MADARRGGLVAVLFVLNVLTTSTALVMGYVALKRTGPTGTGNYGKLTIPERVNRLELERMHFSVFLEHQEEELRARNKLFERTDRLEENMVTATNQITALYQAYQTKVSRVSFSTRTGPRPTPTANWWCYFRRECFRSKDACSNGSPEREQECRPAQSAWCGGVSGRVCFANYNDCFHLEVPARELGKPYEPGRPCVQVE